MKMKVTLDKHEIHQIVKDYLFKKFPMKTVDMKMTEDGGAEAILKDQKIYHSID